MKWDPENYNVDTWKEPDETERTEPLNSDESSLPVKAALPSLSEVISHILPEESVMASWDNCFAGRCKFSSRPTPHHPSLLLGLLLGLSLSRSQKTKPKVWPSKGGAWHFERTTRFFLFLQTEILRVCVGMDVLGVGQWWGEYGVGCGCVYWNGGLLSRDLGLAAAAREVGRALTVGGEMRAERQPALNEVWRARAAWVCPEGASQRTHQTYAQRKAEEDWNGGVDVSCEISSSTLMGSTKTHFSPWLWEINS